MAIFLQNLPTNTRQNQNAQASSFQNKLRDCDTNQNERDLLLPNDNQYFTQGKNKSCIVYTFVATRNTELSTFYSFHLNEDETILIRVPTC